MAESCRISRASLSQLWGEGRHPALPPQAEEADVGMAGGQSNSSCCCTGDLPALLGV